VVGDSAVIDLSCFHPGVSKPPAFKTAELSRQTMKTTYCLLLFLPVIAAAQKNGEAPPHFVERALRIAGKLSSPISDIRVEVARVTAEISIDPPLEPDRFERLATAMAIVSGDYFRAELTAIVERLRTARWVHSNAISGYSRLRIRFVGPWNEHIVELFVSEEKSAIRFDNRWYALDADVVSGLVQSLNDCVTKGLNNTGNTAEPHRRR
jgi:hypothetical protein